MKSKIAALCTLLALIYTSMGNAVVAEVNTTQQGAPFYSNWTFWQWIVSLTALVFSLAPYVIKLIKGPHILLHVMNKISIQHTLGNPNIKLFLNIQNNGGRPVRIREITLEICKDEKTFTIPAQSYYPDVSDNKMAVLAPFRLLPENDWSHTVYFYPDFSRDEDIAFRTLAGNIRTNILEKIPPNTSTPPNGDHTFVAADAVILQPAIDFFTQHFMWNTGEYTGTVTIITEPSKAKTSYKFRFNLYETESNELRGYAKDYKYGLGVCYFNADKHPGLSVTTSKS